MRDRAAAGSTGRALARPRSPRTRGGEAAGCRQEAQSVDTSSLPALEAEDGALSQRTGVRSTRARHLTLHLLLVLGEVLRSQEFVLATQVGMQSVRPAMAGLVLLCMHNSASSTVFSMATGTHWAVAGGQPSALRLRGGGDAAHAAKAAGEPGHTAGAAGPRLRRNAQREYQQGRLPTCWRTRAFARAAQNQHKTSAIARAAGFPARLARGAAHSYSRTRRAPASSDSAGG